MTKKIYEPFVNYLLAKTDEDNKISSYNSEIIDMALSQYITFTEEEESLVQEISSGLMQITRNDGKKHNISYKEFDDYLFLTVAKDMVAQTSN